MERVRRLARLWDWLPAFRAAAESEQVTAASRTLSVSPSAVSRTLKLLEADLGRSLFDRRGRSITLNPAGEVLLAAVRTAMRTLDEALSVMAEEQFVGPVMIASVEPLTSACVAPALQDLMRLHPGVTPQLSVAAPADVVAALLRGDVDVAFLHEAVDDPHVALTPLGHMPLSVFATPAHSAVGEKRLSGHAFVALSPNPRGVSRDGWPAGLPRRVAAEVDGFASAAALCAHGGWLAVLPDVLAADYPVVRVRGPKLTPLPLFAVFREHLPFGGRAEAVVSAVAGRLAARGE